jgi:hypothetical protein
VLGIVLGILAVVASIPLLLSAFGHYDLLRMKARYGLSEDELDEFMRLVPRISNGPAMAGMAPGERRRHARDTAAGMVRAGRRGGR